MSDIAQPADLVASRRLGTVTGVAGLVTIALVVGALIGTHEEPAFTAFASEFLTHYRAPNTVAAPLRSFVFTVGLVSFVWFAGALTTMLRRAEGEPSWRSTVALACGVLFVASVMFGNEIAVTFRANDTDAQIAMYAFEEGQAGFANARVALGSFTACCGWIMISTRFLPRWLGWAAVAIGAALVLARISWANPIWLLPYGMFWLWMLTVAVVLLRRSLRSIAPSV